MAAADMRCVRASSGEHHATKAAGRCIEADASITDIDEDLDTRDDAESSEAELARVCRSAAAESKKQLSGPACRGASLPRPSTNVRGLSNGRSNPVASRRDSDEGGYWAQLEANGLQQPAPPLAPPQQHSSGSSGSTHRRHANGLPARAPSGPLPGMPFLTDLLSRYSVRQAPASGPQVSLVSGRLYVGDRLREAMTVRKSDPSPSAPVRQAHASFPTPDMLIPTYADQSFVPSSYMDQRRAEKEQRAFYTGQHRNQQQHPQHQRQHQRHQQQQGDGRPTSTLPEDSAGRGTATARKSLPVGRPALASAPLASGLDGGGGTGGGGPTVGNARQRKVREGVERWLESSENSAREQDGGDGGGGGGGVERQSSRDPSLMYRQYGIFRAYDRQSQGLWPSMSLPTAARSGGHRVAFERKRTSSGASGGSPTRPSSQPATWTPSRQSVW